jgi:hypothetical protein
LREGKDGEGEYTFIVDAPNVYLDFYAKSLPIIIRFVLIFGVAYD